MAHTLLLDKTNHIGYMVRRLLYPQCSRQQEREQHRPACFPPQSDGCVVRSYRAAWPVWCAWQAVSGQTARPGPPSHRMARLDVRWRCPGIARGLGKDRNQGISKARTTPLVRWISRKVRRGCLRALTRPAANRATGQLCLRVEPDAPRMGVPRPIAARTISARLPIPCATPNPVPHRPRGS